MVANVMVRLLPDPEQTPPEEHDVYTSVGGRLSVTVTFLEGDGPLLATVSTKATGDPVWTVVDEVDFVRVRSGARTSCRVVASSSGVSGKVCLPSK
jgi:hypothetical protein